MRRALRFKLFLGSTTEEVEQKLMAWTEQQNVCVGNYVDAKLHKLGGVYQLLLVYAVVVEAEDGTNGNGGEVRPPDAA